MNKKTVRDVDLKGKKVIMRVDFNVPLNAEHQITDDTRIKAAEPTIKYVLEQGAALILMSHLGRPKGKGYEADFSLRPVCDYLSKAEEGKVKKTDDMSDEEYAAKKADMKAKKQQMAEKLSTYGDVYVNDAFGTAHRDHASTASIAKYMKAKGCPSVAGFLLEKEINFLGNAVENAVHPFVAIIGGAKVSGKLEVLQNLMKKVDAILIGGGMAYTFLKAQGHQVGKSLVEEELLDIAKQTLADAKANNVDFVLPVDNLAADKFDNDANITVVGDDIPADLMALDIGPKTIEKYASIISTAKTIVWNGPMGCFEMSNFSKGTFGVCEAVAEATEKNGAISVIGGGDSVSAVNKSGLASKMSHISTGGGASLEFLEGKVLPGVAALDDK